MVIFGFYMINIFYFIGVNVGMVYSFKGIVVIIMSGIMGIIVDKWLCVECVYMLCYLVCVGVFFYVVFVIDLDMMFWVMLVNVMVFMLIIVLLNSVFYFCFVQVGFDLVIVFLFICVFGMVGFIVVMWVVSLLYLELSSL